MTRKKEEHVLLELLEIGAGRREPHEVIGVSRRGLLKLVSYSGLLGLVGPGLASCTQQQLDDFRERVENRPVRRNVATLTASDPIIQSYESAIDAMRNMDGADARNWNAFAQIHMNACRHRTWLFLPWHRAYLFHFEQICRELSGDESFALPYWNWTENPEIPSMFLNASSPLYVSGRSAGAGDTADEASVGETNLSNIQSQTNFLLYAGGEVPLNHSVPFPRPGDTGLLEGSPHNYIHNFVGGVMMTGTSPRDPLFWLHHCRVDELWVDWNINRGNANVNDSRWTQTEFADFVDRQGNPAATRVIATVLQPLLSYRYDTQGV